MSFFKNLSPEVFKALTPTEQHAFVYRALIDKDSQSVKKMVAWGLDVNGRILNNVSIMEALISTHQTELIVLFLEHNYDIHATYSNTHSVLTPLIHAIITEREDLAQLFLRYGANPNSLNFFSKAQDSALQTAITHNLPETVQVLLKYGADIHYTNKMGENVVDTDAKYSANNTDTLRQLLAYGAPIAFYSPRPQKTIDATDKFDNIEPESQEQFSSILWLLGMQDFDRLQVLLSHQEYAILDNPEYRQRMLDYVVDLAGQEFLTKIISEYEAAKLQREIQKENPDTEDIRATFKL